jgi:hypothetical protein
MTRDPARSMVTFIVRTSRDPGGCLRGVVERVRTGEKERFTGADGLGRLIERMVTVTKGGREKP